MSKDLLSIKKNEMRALLNDESIKFDDPKIINLYHEIYSLENTKPKSKYGYFFILFIFTLSMIGIICITKTLL